MSTQKELREQMLIAEQNIDLAKAVQRLRESQEFKKVFSNHIFKDYVLGLVNEMQSHSSESPEYLNIVSELESVSRVQAYLNHLIDKGQWSQADLINLKAIPDSELL